MLLGHRYYDPEIGRFLTRDPAKSGNNWYDYVSNIPLAFYDPTGLWWNWILPLAVTVAIVALPIDAPILVSIGIGIAAGGVAGNIGGRLDGDSGDSLLQDTIAGAAAGAAAGVPGETWEAGGKAVRSAYAWWRAGLH